MGLAVVDPADRVEQLIELTASLATALDAQTRAFEARRLAEVAAGTGRFAELASLYRRECARVRAEPALIAGAPRARRDVLKAATRDYQARLVRHGGALNAARVVTEGVVRAVADEVVRRRKPVSGYGPRGALASGDSSAITLNRRA